jgi:diphthamide synthase (EF-2-diphthine--ammonia ligase)
MKLKLTSKAEAELELINAKFEENEDAYFELTEYETLVTDAGMYEQGAYAENEFKNLEKWCKLVGKSEYVPKYLKKHPTAVLDKVNKMINEGLLVVVE